LPRQQHAQAQLINALWFLLGIVLMGTFGYHFLEGWSLIDSLYMTIISITTTGFKEVHPLSSEGKWMTMFVVIFGFSALAYSAGRGAQYLFEIGLFRRRRMQNKINHLKNHTIVCGFGRMGQEICRMLQENGAPFIVIEREQDSLQELAQLDYPFLEGDANADEMLEEAGISKAKALISVLSSDADNVFTVLTARGLNRDLLILARAVSEASQSKLRKAGADKVVLPYLIGGQRIALSLLKPAIMDFIEVLADVSRLDIHIESIVLTAASELCGVTLASTFISADLDVIIVMIRRADGSVVYNPKGATTLLAADQLMAIGKPDALATLEKIASPV
jgi:voltage-gated potassium channel